MLGTVAAPMCKRAVQQLMCLLAAVGGCSRQAFESLRGDLVHSFLPRRISPHPTLITPPPALPLLPPTHLHVHIHVYAYLKAFERIFKG